MNYPHVVIGCPVYAAKEYCLKEWIEQVTNFTYPKEKLSVILVDNSKNNHFYKKLIKLNLPSNFRIEHVKSYEKSQYARVAMALEVIRKYTLDKGASYLFSLEIDNFPKENWIIEKLLSARKSIIGAPYHIGLGEQSTLCIQVEYENDNRLQTTYNIDKSAIDFLDGTVKMCYSCGLGQTLIHNSVLRRFVFRNSETKTGANQAPDSLFAFDMKFLNQDIYIDTSILVEHRNNPHTLLDA